MTDLVERARFLAAGQDDPHSVTISELCDEIERLVAALVEISATFNKHRYDIRIAPCMIAYAALKDGGHATQHKEG